MAAKKLKKGKKLSGAKTLGTVRTLKNKAA